jgi:hypothetical protein
MTVNIDVTKFSKTEVISLLQEMFKANMITKEIVDEVFQTKTINGIDMTRIEKLIDKHFEEYDEVFRKLA